MELPIPIRFDSKFAVALASTGLLFGAIPVSAQSLGTFGIRSSGTVQSTPRMIGGIAPVGIQASRDNSTASTDTPAPKAQTDTKAAPQLIARPIFQRTPPASALTRQEPFFQGSVTRSSPVVQSSPLQGIQPVQLQISPVTMQGGYPQNTQQNWRRGTSQNASAGDQHRDGDSDGRHQDSNDGHFDHRRPVEVVTPGGAGSLTIVGDNYIYSNNQVTVNGRHVHGDSPVYLNGYHYSHYCYAPAQGNRI